MSCCKLIIILIFVKIVYTFLKFFSTGADILFVISFYGDIIMKKITTPSYNRCQSVELILRGAKKRRAMAYSLASEVNSNAGVKANLRAVK